MVVDNGVLNGVTAEVSRDIRQADETAADGRAERLAARAARRMAQRNHAPCAGPDCTHRNHRRDVRHAALMLEALDLTGVSPPTKADYDGTTGYHSMSRSEAVGMRGGMR